MRKDDDDDNLNSVICVLQFIKNAIIASSEFTIVELFLVGHTEAY